MKQILQSRAAPIPRLFRLSLALWLSAALLAPPNAKADEALDDATFGPLTVHHAADEPKGVVLLISGMGDWKPALTAVARQIAHLDYVVVGISLNEYLARLERRDVACADPATDFAQLNLAMEQRYPLAIHLSPILLGQSGGAALVYAALAQASPERFHAGIAVDFCPELPLRKPLCKGQANLESAMLPNHQGVLLKPILRMPTTWFVFQNRPACDGASAAQFVRSIQLTQMAEIAGTQEVATGSPPIIALLQWLDPGIVRQVQPDASVSGVPLTEVPATGGPNRPQLAILLSGNGGWALLDRAVTAELARNGLPTVGWDSLNYFWKARQPDEVALDLERTLRHYLAAWKKQRVVLIGYSFGANVLPAVVNRLPRELRDRIDLLALLGPSDHASFEFSLTDWISDRPDEDARPVRPELERLNGVRRLCIHGAAEEDALCPKLADLGIVVEKVPGDHRFDDDYPGLARRILDQLPASQSPARN